MADNSGSGGIGVLGVLVGALIVIVVGAGLLFYSGQIGDGDSSTTLNIDTQKSTTGASGSGSSSGGGSSTPTPSSPAPSGGTKQ